FEMLKVAKEKCQNVEFHEGYASKLPFKDSSVDIVSIVYGIRNVVDREDALKEFYRVLKKDGLLVVLEFTKEEKKSILQKLASFYNTKVLPFLGGMISGSYEAYRYLPSSIDSFLTADMLKTEMESVGFTPIFVKGYSANISTTLIVKK
ncbi:MAG: class I SAM-dependent methyltransferase, partial [Campylobacterales bacterium]